MNCFKAFLLRKKVQPTHPDEQAIEREAEEMNAAIEKDCAQAAADGRDELYLIIGGSPGAVLKVTRGLHAKGRLLKWNDDITYDIPADGTAIGGLFRLIPRIKPAHKAADGNTPISQILDEIKMSMRKGEDVFWFNIKGTDSHRMRVTKFLVDRYECVWEIRDGGFAMPVLEGGTGHDLRFAIKFAYVSKKH
jgi:hypothetical protein